MQRTIKWMHISDLHFGTESHMETEELREQLITYIRKNEIQCDYIFCTGDIRNGGDTFDRAKGYICNLCDALKTPLNHFFLVPGNHDVNRDIEGRDKAIRAVSFYDSATNQTLGAYDSAKGTIAEEYLKDISRGLEDFNSFVSDIYKDCAPERIGQYENYLSPHFVIQTDDFNILHINSTIVYTKQQERHELILGTWYLREALNSIDENKPTIVLSHFPITSFTQEERKHILTLFNERNVSLWLCGHEHDHFLIPYANLYSIQAGELRNEEKTNATVLLGEYEAVTGMSFIKAVTWFPEGWNLYPIVWNPHGTMENRAEFTFQLASKRQNNAFDYELKKEYINKIFECENPWGEEFKIRVIEYKDRQLTWEWINVVELGEENKTIAIKEVFETPLNEFFGGQYVINHKEYIFNDPKAYYWYYYKGTIQLVEGEIIITYTYGQRLKYVQGGSGALGYEFTGGWNHAFRQFSILVDTQKTIISE